MSRSIGKWFLLSCALAAATLVPAVHAQTVTVLAGQGSSDADGVPASTARMKGVSTNVVAPDGTVYFTEQSHSNARVRKIASDGRVSTLASGLSYPSGIARDASGNVYVSDSGNGRILKISAAGVISTFAGNTGLNCSGTLGDGGQAINAGFCWNSWMTFDASGNPQWDCTNSGDIAVVKIGWTRGSTNRTPTATALEKATIPSVVFPVTPASTL